MKKKTAALLLAMTVTGMLFSGCGESEQAVSGSVETTVEAGAAGETSAETEETAQAAETESTEETAEEAAEPAGGVAESAETATAGGTAVSQTAEAKPAAVAAEVSESTETAETAEPVASYSYTDMDAVMWATAAVNVRDLPSVEGTRVGGLSGGQEVRVTGVCNETGWYRLEGGDRYVSGSYLSDSAPVAVASNPSTSAADSTASQATQGTVGAAPVAAQTSGAYSEAQLVGEFLTILNNQRAAEGLSQVSGGSDALNSDALASVTAVHANFTHDSVVRNSGVTNENIGQNAGSAQEMFDAWYASDGHRVAMMDPNLQSVACARYLNTWVMVGIASNPAVEMPVEQAVEEGYLEKVSETDVGNGQTVTTYITPGAGEAVSVEELPDWMQDMVNQSREEYADYQP